MDPTDRVWYIYDRWRALGATYGCLEQIPAVWSRLPPPIAAGCGARRGLSASNRLSTSIGSSQSAPGVVETRETVGGFHCAPFRSV